MTTQRLFILCGLPFSGKSTLARALAARLGVTHIEVDAVHAERGVPLTDRGPEKADRIAAYRMAHDRLDAALANGDSVVFDAVGYRATQRERSRRIAARHDVESLVIALDVSREEADARRRANRIAPQRVDVSSADFTEVSDRFQAPLSHEASVTYHPSEPVAVWLDRVIRPLLQDH